MVRQFREDHGAADVVRDSDFQLVESLFKQGMRACPRLSSSQTVEGQQCVEARVNRLERPETLPTVPALDSPDAVGIGVQEGRVAGKEPRNRRHEERWPGVSGKDTCGRCPREAKKSRTQLLALGRPAASSRPDAIGSTSQRVPGTTLAQKARSRAATPVRSTCEVASNQTSSGGPLSPTQLLSSTAVAAGCWPTSARKTVSRDDCSTASVPHPESQAPSPATSDALAFQQE
jgi:hypothetical protein